MNLIDRAKNILTNPKTEWNTINAETADPNKILVNYVFPLAAAAAIAAFIGYAFIGFKVVGITFKGIDWGIYQALTVLISAVISVYCTAMIVDLLAPSFGSEKNFNKSLQLVAYSFTPAWIGGLLSVIPAIGIVGALFGLYGLYLMYIGLPKLKHTPADKQTSYFILIIISTIVVYMVVGWILTLILMKIFGLSYGIINLS